jgi:hypothetical protein
MDKAGDVIDMVQIDGEWLSHADVAARIRLLPGAHLIRVGPSAISLGRRTLVVVSWISPDGVRRHAQEWGNGQWAPGFLDRFKSEAGTHCTSLQATVDAAERLRSEDFAEVTRAWSHEELGALCRSVTEVWASMGGGLNVVRVGFGPGGYLLAAPSDEERHAVADALAPKGYVFDRVPPGMRVCALPPRAAA